MKEIKSVETLKEFLGTAKKRGAVVGLVPTMGYLHDGHISLIRAAKKHAGKNGVVVVSIYVNPLQFGPNEDFKKYPRDLKRDRRICMDEGVDVLFLPSDSEMCPALDGPNAMTTFVVEEKLSALYEGESRPGHFKGVTTIVAKLFNIVQPDFAVFGEKDYQQLMIIKRMVRDLNYPVKIVSVPTVRDQNNVALSSRLEYLKPESREMASILWNTIQKARDRVATRKSILTWRLRDKLMRYINRRKNVKVDYIAFFDSQTLEPVREVKKGTHMAVAMYVDGVRLIDNAKL
jgi:pantoate--beta-alanine ligase